MCSKRGEGVLGALNLGTQASYVGQIGTFTCNPVTFGQLARIVPNVRRLDDPFADGFDAWSRCAGFGQPKGIPDPVIVISH